MGYWKSRVVPTMKKLFERIPTKKALVVEASKSLTFDDSKEAINKEIEEKRTELEPKVVEIYEATSAELKALVKEPKEDGLMKHSAEVHKFLEALVEIGFPGSKAACEVSSTSSGPVTFIFEKVCLFLPAEKSREVDIVEEVVKTEEPAKEEEVISGDKEREIVEEKKEEVQPAPVPAPAAAEVKKTAVEEEKKAAAEDKKPVEEVKKEVVAAAPVAETPSTKAPETLVVETPAKTPEAPAKAPEAPAKAPEAPAKAPETPAAEPKKA
ncbi:hypothetical protein BRARA_F03730 [Brassica rapa]|uniref:Plasma membrane-associated cation-binding protein 1 n=3 Tax=Brassica campestris TaxID=3711 RepID=A0A397Z4G6_BRACM|nr:plasma membrane-associated cation-binding protein 1 [Brassica rapa]XP_033128315.1 plasma membrane-associated cation-binding protein 1 [Brassica rapa]KAG5395258.1 hypothetical protein IGI04_025221 [Brassica rapa subsp. trilocularis]RID60582.1 hypothetical protein BRARA_F03730 [Brassica rapa]